MSDNFSKQRVIQLQAFFAVYQQAAGMTAVYPESAKVIYPALGLASEAGEVSGKIKKCVRDNGSNFADPEFKKAISKELGDVLWYVSQLAKDLDLDLGTIAIENLAKLTERKKKGTLQGNGDNR